MLVISFRVLSRHEYRTFIQTYSATSPFNPLWEIDKTFSPSYSSSQITYFESGSGRIFVFPLPQKKDCFHCFRFRFHIPALNSTNFHPLNVASASKQRWDSIFFRTGSVTITVSRAGIQQPVLGIKKFQEPVESHHCFKAYQSSKRAPR